MNFLKKLISITMSLCTLFISILSFIPITKAAVQGTITGNEVRLRSAPTTNSTTYKYLYSGNIVSITNTNKVAGDGCSEGWYNVDYNGQSGYVCSSYVEIGGTSSGASYNRPWTSPKKAIIGGAEFMQDGYISAGQNTSYLKKFNVNPNSSYALYNHQYQANIAAPNNEAKNSYNSYRDNGLLNVPLHFVIPIYNNMPAYTTHPVTGKEEGGTSVVSDQSFEAELNKQGFDETYKVWLRALHNKYPNWTFEALHTNLDFNSSVINEKVSSAVSKTCTACLDANNTYYEAGWGTPNDQTLAFFMDPRNFLMEDSILMFEDLSYNEYYTEDMVKSVLKGTFMEGKDNVDNLSYSSLFMEAGKINNISPVYLASLSRQEVGSTKGLVTSGEEFSYKGITYIGFYNFYNIGAYGSEENPAKAGLVYASAGSIPNSNGVYVGNIGGETSTPVTKPEEPSKPNVTPVATHLSNMGLNRKGTYITNLSLNTTIDTLKNKTNGSELTFKNASGSTLGNTEKITTGTAITFSTGETYTIVIYGDLTGDGLINSADLLRMRQYLLGQVSLSGAYLESAKLVNVSGNINSADLLRLRQYLLGQKDINQA